MRNVYRILVGETEGKKRFKRPSYRWEDNIRMDPTEIGREGVDWIHLAQNRDQWRVLVNTVNELSGSIKGGEYPD
jgi:hypothetical protein